MLAIAEAHGVTPGQVLLAFDPDRGISVIPKPSNPDRMAQNLAAVDGKLSQAELDKLLAIHTQPGKYTSMCDYGVYGGNEPGMFHDWLIENDLGYDYDIKRDFCKA